MKRKLILDVDTGTDDAVAIMLAALHEDLDLVGITTVNGNAEVHYCTDNSLRVLDHIASQRFRYMRLFQAAGAERLSGATLKG